MERAQKFLSNPRIIEKFSNSKLKNAKAFRRMLDKQTEALRVSLPLVKNNNGTSKGQYWGSARKFLNIFLFECVLNKHLCRYYRLAKLEPWLEVPLDNFVHIDICEDYKIIEKFAGCDLFLPRWKGIIHLTPNDNNEFQFIASAVARITHMERVHLDLVYWTTDRKKKIDK